MVGVVGVVGSWPAQVRRTLLTRRGGGNVPHGKLGPREFRGDTQNGTRLARIEFDNPPIICLAGLLQHDDACILPRFEKKT